MNNGQILDNILNEELISPVFQPIVNLENGDIAGYEALSRITLKDCPINIEELFNLASAHNKLWALEKLCRSKALEKAICKPFGTKLSLNVAANIINDPELKSGFTSQKLSQYNINPEDIIFEITEKNAFDALDVFISSIDHYKKQNFKIGIDDFGSGYSGLNRVCAFSPDFIKLDMNLIRDIDKDPIKKSAVSATIKFCKESGIKVVAEGVETLEELKVLIRLGADFAQGYYLARPHEQFKMLDSTIVQQILNHRSNKNSNPKVFSYGKISEIGTVDQTIFLDDPSLPVYELMKSDSSICEFFVVDSSNYICGVLPRRHILEKYSGEYGYNLYKKTKAKDIMIKEFLAVDENMSIDDVSNLAMSRNATSIYDCIAVTRDGKYLNCVSVKDLLLASIQLRVKRATDCNPLTGLPGNNQIQEVIANNFTKKTPWSIAYIDLDNFKAYNDAYGFKNGDEMLKSLADTISNLKYNNLFIGHIGGDDFVMILNSHEIEHLCHEICNKFRKSIEPLYSKLDLERGYIISKNRSGFTQNFPIVSLSISVVTNKYFNPSTIEELSSKIAEIKKKTKQIEGNSVIVI